MAEYKLTREEIETNINFSAADNFATVYTCSKIMIRRLDRLVELRPNDVTVIAEDRFSKTYTLPKKWVMRITPPIELSEEQKEAARQRLLEYRKKAAEAKSAEANSEDSEYPDELLDDEDFDAEDE